MFTSHGLGYPNLASFVCILMAKDNISNHNETDPNHSQSNERKMAVPTAHMVKRTVNINSLGPKEYQVCVENL